MSAENEIRDIIVRSYINGIHGSQVKEEIMGGFHESFRMLVKKDNSLVPVTIDQWLENIKIMKTQFPQLWNKETVYKTLNVDITGNAAAVKIEVFKGDKYFSTDYMLLYNFEDGWKIVSKIFTS